MNAIYALPETLTVNGRAWDIDPDFRQVLRILTAFEDPDLTDGEKAALCLYNLYPDMDDIPREDLQAALDAAMDFIDHGADGKKGPRTMDWTQDAPLIFPAVNRVAGFEVRSVDYMHWWTFLGLFMEIKDSVYSTVLSVRAKKAKGKKLEKWEQDFFNENLSICRIRPRLTEAEKAEKERLMRILG